MSASSDDDDGDGEPGPGDGARIESGPGDGAKLQTATPARGAHGGGEHQAASPGAVAADALMRLAGVLTHDGSASVPAAQASAAALLACVLVLSARLCASLATPTEDKKKD